MLFCLFWGWGKISCNWVWGPETARSHDVWATICHYTICWYRFKQTGSSLKLELELGTFQGCVSSNRLSEGLMRLDTFKVVRSHLMARIFPSRFLRKEPVDLKSLPASRVRERSIPQKTLSFMYPFWLCFSTETLAPVFSNNRSSILVCTPTFPLPPLPVFQWFQLVLLDCVLQRDP